METGVAQDVAYQFVKKNGEVMDILLSAIAERDAEDRVARTLAVLIDVTQRNQAEEAYRALVDNSLQGLCILQEGRVVFANDALAEMFGYTVDEILALEPDAALASFTPKGRAFVRQQSEARRLGTPMANHYEIGVYTKDGDLRWTEQFVSVIAYQGAPALQIAVVDITERKESQRQLAASLQQKEILLREVHHRVKNSLAVAASMLELQALELDDPDVTAALTRSQQRINAMARVHDHLYRSDDLRAIEMDDYLTSLTSHLRDSMGRPDVTLRVEVDDVCLDLDTASPCGLIVSELVTNAFKHAFPGGAPSDGAPSGDDGARRICVRLLREGPLLSLRVKDNGVGLASASKAPPKAQGGSLGMQLVELFAQDLGGSFRSYAPDGAAGVVFEVRFPYPNPTV
jgi:PAS domain S-box-containing protein